MKRFHGRRIAAVLLSLAVCITLFAGCGKSISKKVTIDFPEGTQLTSVTASGGLDVTNTADSIVLNITREGSYTLNCEEAKLGAFTMKVSCRDNLFLVDEYDGDLELVVTEE